MACGSNGRAAASPGDGGDSAPVLKPAEMAALAKLSPDTLPPPPADASDHLADDAKAAKLGQTLFYDTSFSGQLLDGDNDGSANALGHKGDVQKVACAGCHLPESAFSDTRSVRQQISLAAGWGKRRAPSLLDVGQSKLLMWDGRRDAFYNQIFGVIESPVEMNSSRLFAAEQVFAQHRDAYEAVFGSMPPLDDAARFPALSPTETGCRELDANNACPTPMRGTPGDGADYDHMAAADQDSVTRVVVNAGKALGAYERLLTCGPSRFDRWMHGDRTALGASEQRGAALFVGRAGCVSCHSGPYFSDERFHDVGMRAQLVATVFLNPNDRGAADGLAAVETDPLNVRGKFSDGDDQRLPASVEPSMVGAFRTPRLRCASRRPSFMHTGQMTSLDDVVAFFDAGGDTGGFAGTSEIQPLGLSDVDRADIVSFLGALDGSGPSNDLLSPP
jgi:cytochrome c peroxidase